MNLLDNKKSQSGGKAAIVVAIIMGLIVLYILFLPPEQRQDLLDENYTADDDDDSTAAAKANKTLLLEHPGTLHYLAVTEYDKTLPPMSLYIKTEASVIKSVDSVTIKRGWFTKQRYNLSVHLPDLEKVENPILSFNVDDHKGDLQVFLNGNLVYDRSPETSSVVINLPRDAIKERNSIVFLPTAVGAKFWATNQYQLSDVRVIADMVDTSKQAAQSRFILSATETSNLEKTKLRFYVDCTQKLDLSQLEIFINGHEVYSLLPYCGDIVNQPFSPDILVSGENVILFKTQFAKPTTAVYNIDQVRISLELDEPSPPVYYFDLDDEYFEKVVQGTKKVKLNMLFTDDVTRKRATLYINGRVTHLDTEDEDFDKVISDFVKAGSNAIKIDPKDTLEIVDLEVRYE